jgi:hypothetical protein
MQWCPVATFRQKRPDCNIPAVHRLDHVLDFAGWLQLKETSFPDKEAANWWRPQGEECPTRALFPKQLLCQMSKRPPQDPTASDLSVRERVLLFCVASGTETPRPPCLPAETRSRRGWLRSGIFAQTTGTTSHLLCLG